MKVGDILPCMDGQTDILRAVTDIAYSIGRVCVIETCDEDERVEYGLIALSFDSYGGIDQVLDIRQIEGDRGAHRIANHYGPGFVQWGFGSVEAALRSLRRDDVF